MAVRVAPKAPHSSSHRVYPGTRRRRGDRLVCISRKYGSSSGLPGAADTGQASTVPASTGPAPAVSRSTSSDRPARRDVHARSGHRRHRRPRRPSPDPRASRRLAGSRVARPAHRTGDDGGTGAIREWRPCPGLGRGPIGSVDRDDAAGRDGLRSTTAQPPDHPDDLDGRKDRNQSPRQEPQQEKAQALLQHGIEYGDRTLPGASEAAGYRCSALAMFASRPRRAHRTHGTRLLSSESQVPRRLVAQETHGPTVSLT